MRLILFIIAFFIFSDIQAQKPNNYDVDLEGMYSNSIELITPQDLSKIQNEGSVYILDAREKDEFNVSHIPKAIFVGYEKFSIKTVSEIPIDAQIIVYCSLGVRSEKIGEKLVEAGYNNVKNLYGGVFEWIYQDLPVVDKRGTRTIRVHTYDEEWSKWLLKGEKVY